MVGAATRQRSTTDTLLEHIAMGLLMAGPKHGYALHQDFVETFGAVWQAGRSKFYATLADLQEGGYLEAAIEPQESHPPRKVYRLTGEGERAFRRWLQEPVSQPRDVRAVVPVKLRFFEMLGLPGAGELLDAQIAACQGRIDREAKRAHTPRAEEDDLFAELIYEFRRRQLLGMIGWLEYCKARFTEEPDLT